MIATVKKLAGFVFGVYSRAGVARAFPFLDRRFGPGVDAWKKCVDRSRLLQNLSKPLHVVGCGKCEV